MNIETVQAYPELHFCPYKANGTLGVKAPTNGPISKTCKSKSCTCMPLSFGVYIKKLVESMYKNFSLVGPI